MKFVSLLPIGAALLLSIPAAAQTVEKKEVKKQVETPQTPETPATPNTAVAPKAPVAPHAPMAPNAPVPDIEPLGSLRAAATAPQRYQFTLLMTFAGLALLLAAIGVYALVAHSVAQRRKELAIRLALGAPAGAITGLIAGQALAPVGLGALAGLAAAGAAGRLL